MKEQEYLKVKFNSLKGATSFERTKILSAKALLEKVVNSKRFKERVLNHKYKNEYGYYVTGFVDSQNKTNTEIYEYMMDSTEILLPERDGEIDVDLTIYKSSWFRRHTVGYTFTYTIRTWMNRRFMSKRNFYEPDVAMNIYHEYGHKKGFIHDSDWNRERDFSVPYALGYLVRELCREELYRVSKGLDSLL